MSWRQRRDCTELPLPSPPLSVVFTLRGWVRAALHSPTPSWNVPSHPNHLKAPGIFSFPRCLQLERAGVVFFCFPSAIDTHGLLWMVADHRTDIFTAQSVTNPTFQIVTQLGTRCFINRVKIGFSPCTPFCIYVHLNFIFFYYPVSSVFPSVLYLLTNNFPVRISPLVPGLLPSFRRLC